MVSIVFFIVIIIFSITLYATSLSATKPNKDILLGVTLPNGLIKAEIVQRLVKEYKSSYNKLFGIAIILASPIYLLSAYPSLSLIYLFLWIIILLYINNKIAIKYFKKLYSLKREYISSANLTIIGDVDDDIYWEKGYYCNPNDPSLMVEKRIGYGMTVNMASKKGKWFVYGTLIPIVLLVIFLAIQLSRMDFASFNMSLNGEVVKISAPLYGYSFNINEIEEVMLIEKLPKGYKSSGAGTDRYSLGNFNLNDYGKSKVYVYKNNPPYLVIKLKNIYVLINGKTPDITLNYYRLLKK